MIAFRRSGYPRNNGLRYVFRDHLGSTSVIANGGGTKLWEDRYKAFGDFRYTWIGGDGHIPVQTDYRYTGQRYDATVGLYDYRARWYDPALGRFIQPDAIVPQPGQPQSLNRYSYAGNNPLVYNDPSGHQGIPGFPNPWEWFAGLFGVPSSSEFADKTGLEEYRSLTADVSKSVLKYLEQVGRRLEVATETGMNMLTAGGYDILTGVIGKNLGRDLSTPERITRISSSVVGMGVGKVVEKTLTESLARTFMGAKYTAIELSEDTVLYSAGSGSRGPGQFFSFDVPVSETQVRIDKAIRPFWPGGGTSPIDTVFKVKVPAGTVIYVGEVGYQGEFYLGGTNQVVIPSSWLIKGLEVLEKWEIIK